MKKIALIILLFPCFLVAQEDKVEKEKKRTSFFVSTSQGISTVFKEALSNTTKKTYPLKTGYAFSLGTGISIISKKGKSLSDIRLVYKSFSNGIDNIVSPQSPNGVSSKTSSERYNYLALGYHYSRFIWKIKDYKTFFTAGIEFSYILNRKIKVRHDDYSTNLTVKGSNISNNVVVLTPPTFLLGYGVDLGKGISNIGTTSRVSLYLTLDQTIVFSSPANQYFTTRLNYQLIF